MTARKKPKMQQTPNMPDPADLIATSALTLAGQKGWRTLELGEIATEAGVTLAELAKHYPGKPAILDGFERMIDRRMLAGAAAGDVNDPTRDRLFDVIMERFDALLPYRDGIRRIARELPLDPSSGLVLACALPRSIHWMYAGARVAVDGPLMPLKLATLGCAYMSAFRVWLNDLDQDLAKTMAALDKALNRAERVSNGFGASSPAKPAPGPQPPPAEAVPENEADIS